MKADKILKLRASLWHLNVLGRRTLTKSTYEFLGSRGVCSEAAGSVRRHSKDETVPVLIVGAGPVGLVLSMLLNKLGISCALLEKSDAFSLHPQAHFVNNRSMEIFRKLDGLADEILELQPPIDLWRKFLYCTSLSGPMIGAVDHMKPQDFDRIVSPISVGHFSQYKLVRLLVRRLLNLGFHIVSSDNCDDAQTRFIKWDNKILMGHEFNSFKPTADGIMVDASVHKEGKLVQRNIHCNILIGADGAGSTVRKLVGINMKGEREMQYLVSVHFLSTDLGSYLLQQRPGMLFFIFNPEAIGVLVAHDLNQGEFVLQIPYYPPQQDLEDFTIEKCREIIFKLVGHKLNDVVVRDVKPWVMNAEVAEKYSAVDNKVLLMGDAAHRFPPAGGFGMNTGVQDSHNLAWKIASVIYGIASPAILNTYEMERRPIALFNTSLSIDNFNDAMSVPSALGLNPNVANSVHRAINSGLVPSGVQKMLLEGIFAAGRAQMLPFVLNEANPLGSSRLAKVRSILEEGKSLQLQFPAEDLGYRYLEGALIADADSLPKDQKGIYGGRRKEYVPVAEVGARLPHMNVCLLDASSDENGLSTLDLVRGDKVEFLLMIGPRQESYQLASAAFEAADGIKLPLRVCILWPEDSSPRSPRDGIELLESHWGKVIEVKIKTTPGWTSSSLSCSWWHSVSKGAVLVRPDDHIAWQIAYSESFVSSTIEMGKIFARILRLS